jgi:hypothetical protein
MRMALQWFKAGCRRRAFILPLAGRAMAHGLVAADFLFLPLLEPSDLSIFQGF